MLISDSRFDLVWFRLSCDHGWIRSGSVNVRKQQQQQQPTVIRTILYTLLLNTRGVNKPRQGSFKLVPCGITNISRPTPPYVAIQLVT